MGPQMIHDFEVVLYTWASNRSELILPRIVAEPGSVDGIDVNLGGYVRIKKCTIRKGNCHLPKCVCFAFGQSEYCSQPLCCGMTMLLRIKGFGHMRQGY